MEGEDGRKTKQGEREDTTCKTKADRNRMQHKMQTFMDFMKLAAASL